MQVTEHRTFQFKGKFSYSYRSFPKDRVRYRDIVVSEAGTAYQESDSEEPGTYRIIDRGSKLEVRWYYSARSEQRTFTINYNVKKLVECGEDAAVLYYKFIGDDWSKSQQHVLITVLPPDPLEKAEVNAWLHGPLWGEYRIEKNGTISAWCDNFPVNTFFEIRALYPLEAFPKAVENAGLNRADIMTAEARWVERANQKRVDAVESLERRVQREQFGYPLAVVLGFIGLFGVYYLYNRYGRRPELPERKPEFLSEIPSEDPPALISYLVNNEMISGSALVSTLFDLASRGYLEMKEGTKVKPKFWGGTREVPVYHWVLDRAKLRENPPKYAFERSALVFLFTEISGGSDTLDVDDLKSESSKMMKFFSKWKKEVAEEGKSRDWINQESKKGMYWGIALTGILFLISMAGVFFFGKGMLLSAGVSIILFFLSLIIPHNTAQGAMLKNRWKALRKFLKKGRYKLGRETENNIGSYFVYGSALGLMKKDFEEMADFFPTSTMQHHLFWYHSSNPEGFSGEAFSSGFSAMVATASSSMSTATGTGGGASGGGGGGAGGGGGGAG